LDDIPLLNKPYLVEDYRAATRGIPIEKTVFVQCEAVADQCVEEARWVAEQAGEEPRIRGIVAWAPLQNGTAAAAILDQLAEIDLVRGIRRIIQYEEDPAFCLRSGFIDGVRLLSRYGYTFDICIKGPEQFDNAITLVERCSDVAFILDHIGKPNIDRGEMQPWRGQMRRLAALPNTTCKVSGLVVEADLRRWTPADLAPYLDHVFSAFGFDRVCFGGDWPVVLQATEYRRWYETLRTHVSGASESEQDRLFRATAERVYRL
jgi:L-fuconolactonase